jgi:hypothetical protein
MGRSNRVLNPSAGPITDRQYKFNYGKFDGCTIEEVLLVNPKYLTWLHVNKASFKLSAELLAEATGKTDRPTPLTIREFHKQREQVAEPFLVDISDDSIPF